MSKRLRESIHAWLQREARDDAPGAETALREVFSLLPAPTVPDGFARRVLQAGGLLGRAVARPRRVPQWVWRWACTVGFPLTALALLTLPGLLSGLAPVVDAGKALDLGTGLIVGLSRLVARSLTVGRALFGLGETVSSVLSAPLLLALWAFCAALSLGGFRLMSTLVLSDRSSNHAASG